MKTRIIARHQQIVRVDREEIRVPHRGCRSRKWPSSVRRRLDEIDAIIFEDYGKGFLHRRARREDCDDSHATPGRSLPRTRIRGIRSRWKNVTAVKPNRSEAFLAAGLPWSDPVDPARQGRSALAGGRDPCSKKWDTQIPAYHPGRAGHDALQKGTSLASHSDEGAASLRCLGRG